MHYTQWSQKQTNKKIGNMSLDFGKNLLFFFIHKPINLLLIILYCETKHKGGCYNLAQELQSLFYGFAVSVGASLPPCSLAWCVYREAHQDPSARAH